VAVGDEEMSPVSSTYSRSQAILAVHWQSRQTANRWTL